MLEEVVSRSKDKWAEYQRNRDPDLREKLILQHVPLVKHVAGRLAMGLPPHIETQDLFSWGIFGLMEAIERYEWERGARFETYALARIRGAMLDGLRSLDWIPSSVRYRARQLEKVYAGLEQHLGRPASEEEVAAELGVTVEKLREILGKLSACALISLDELWPESEGGDGEPVRVIDGIPDTNSPAPEAIAEFEDRKRLLAEAIAALPERERLVLTLYYYEGLTAKEVAAVLEVSQSRISQLHSQAVLRLRGRLGALEDVLW
ncbi:MAG: FliA/WhiG family RNA polymerase sigma factor [Firmicutes bacterium]|nr:FliA/WhiG family RNA polymerase sigma factor [Bacillota bacterium]